MGRVTLGPLESLCLRWDCLVAFSRMRSTFPVLSPTAIRSSKTGSGDQAKH